MASDYHHGDLPTALRAAAVELIAESGPNGFSLREVARRAGVSHAAPAHHFGGTEGLLTSVAAEGYARVAQEMERAAASATSARDHLIKCGRAYVETALANPGHYGVMIDNDYVDHDNEELLAASLAAYDQLLQIIYAVRDEYNPDLDVDRTATICWATVHGLVELSPILDEVAEKTGTANTPVTDLIETYADTLIAGALP